MKLAKISIKNIGYKPLSSILSVLLLAFGIGIIVLLVNFSKQFEKQFTTNVGGIDMVVGAKGSPLQLILSSVYHIDDPTGNIPLSEYEKLKRNPLVETAIPLAYGDNYKGYRMVGTTLDYPKHYEAELENGNWFLKTGEAVIGAKAAQNTGLKIGDSFSGSHGLTQSIDHHDHFHYKVVGTIKSTGTVVDKLILTDINSVWAVHATEGHSNKSEPEITAAFFSFKSPMANLTVPRMVNKNTSMQAALPAIEVNRLFSLMGSGMQSLRILAILIVIISGISVFLSLLQSLKDRKFELALMRTMGATRGQLLFTILLEGVWVALMGYVLGIILGKLGLLALSGLAQSNFQYQLQIAYFNSLDALLFPLSILLGALAAFVPAWQASKINISKTLSHG